MSDRLTTKDMKRWQAKLARCHMKWKKKGMVSERLGSRAALGPKGEGIWRGYQHYRMDPWTGAWGGIPKSRLATTTLGFSAYNTWSAGLLARNPKCQVLPRLRVGSKHATEVAKDAMLVEALLNYDIQQLEMKRELNRTLFTSFYSPLGGVLRHGFTPSEEFYFDDRGERRMERSAVAVPDKPWVEAVKSWNVRIDPDVEFFDSDGQARYVFFRKLRMMEEIRRNPNLKERADLKPNVNLSGDEARPYAADGSDDPDDGWVESWVCYEAEERTWFEIVEGLDKPLRDRDDWPIPWKFLPYNLLQFNEQDDEPFQVPYMQVVERTLMERNKLRTIMGELVKRLRRVIFVQGGKDGLAEGEWDKLTGDQQDLAEFIGTSMGTDAQTVAHQMQLGGLDTTLLAYDAQLLADVREALGQSQMDRAQRVNVESATEARQIQQGSAIAGGRNQEKLESFIAKAIRHYAIGRQSVTMADELIPLFGVEDARTLSDAQGAKFLQVTPDQLRGEYDFDVVAGSTLQRNRQQDVALVMADLEVAFKNPELMGMFNLNQLGLDYCAARGLSIATHLMTVEQRQQVAGQGPTPEQILNGGKPGGKGGDLGTVMQATLRDATPERVQ
jgi:hypothetical protein